VLGQAVLLVPWRYIADWKCSACGQCCKAYSVVLNFPEWLKIVKNYGAGTTVPDINKLLIKRRSDGACMFLYDLPSVHLCGIQHMKPKACKLWPFKILGMPEFGYASEAVCYYRENKLFVYVDSSCSGLRYGKPTWGFANHTLKEFIEIALGLRSEQYKTTANVNLLQSSAGFRVWA